MMYTKICWFRWGPWGSEIVHPAFLVSVTWCLSWLADFSHHFQKQGVLWALPLAEFLWSVLNYAPRVRTQAHFFIEEIFLSLFVILWTFCGESSRLKKDPTKKGKLWSLAAMGAWISESSRAHQCPDTWASEETEPHSEGWEAGRCSFILFLCRFLVCPPWKIPPI